MARDRLTATIALAALCTFANSSAARDEVPGLLFRAGTVVPPPVIEVDAALPTGHRAGWRLRPDLAKSSGKPAVASNAVASRNQSPAALSRECSAAFPVCVHATRREVRARVLELAASAFRTWSYVAAKPAPLGDGELGGGPELDVYVTEDGVHDGSGLSVHLDPPLLSADRASAWCELAPTRLTERAAALCVAEASAAGIDAAVGPGMRRGWASAQVDALVTADVRRLTAYEDAQREPFQPLLSRELSPRSEAGAAFWEFVDRAWGVAGHGRLPLAMLQMASAPAPLLTPHPEWRNVPDELDVLRHALSNETTRVSEFWTEWALARAFFGDRSSGTHAPESRELGAAGRVAFDWVLDYSSLPRHLAGPNPVYPLGSAYVWMKLDSVPLNATLAFRAEWEAPVTFTWVVVSVDEQGREMNRWRLPHLERATSAETTIVNFEAAAGLLLIGTNLGAIDVSHPFDPDQEPWEPHGYSVYLTQLGP